MQKKHDAICKISVCGFKSIYDKQEIDVLPLTLLAGANSSGKSSIMQPLLLLKQTIEAPSDPGALLLDGPNVRFTQAEQLISRITGKDQKSEFSVGVEFQTGERLDVTFKRDKTMGFDVDSLDFSIQEDQYHIHITSRMTHNDIIKLLSPYEQNFYYIFEKREKNELRWFTYRDRCFLSFEIRKIDDSQRSNVLGKSELYPRAIFINNLERLIHLPGLRGNPRRTYPKSSWGPLFPGSFENYVASLISHWQANDHERLEKLGSALADMGLTWKVKSEPIDDTQVELRVGRLLHSKQGGAKDLVSIADVGFGVSQSLPVVVALLAADEGQVVYLEQPEIHLHPKAQRRLAHILKDAVERGVIAIVETHSSLLLKEIQLLVASGKLDKKLVKLHWFQRKEDGQTIITTADLDNNGAYGDWPEDFGDVELDAEKSYLDAVEHREGMR